MDLLNKLKNNLNSNNYKLTPQREDILKVFLKNKDRHLNAEELYEEVKKINSEVGLATVYRSLELFNKLDIIHQLDFDVSCKRYELNVQGNHHHHLICVRCGAIIEFNDQMLEEFEESIESEHDFEVISHRIKFYGICKNCKNVREGAE